jgi:hypothetical protein
MQVGLAITYTVTAGRSIKVIEELSKDCSMEQQSEAVITTNTDCDVGLTKWIFFFAFVQLFLSQTPNFHDLWCVQRQGYVQLPCPAHAYRMRERAACSVAHCAYIV